MKQEFRLSPGWVFFILTIAGAALFVGPAWGVVLNRLMVDGGAAMAWLGGAWGIGAVLHRIVCRWDVSQSLLIQLTRIGIGLGVISLLTLGLGLAGWLNQPLAWGIMLAPALLGIVLTWHGRLARALLSKKIKDTDETPVPRKNIGEWLIFLLLPSAVLMLVGTLIPPGILWGDEPHGYDVVEYHLQLPREWYEMGRIAPLRHNAFGYFPLNAEMHSLLGMHMMGGPYKAMYLAQLMSALQMVLCVLVIYAAAGRRDKRWGPVAAVLAGALPWCVLVGAVAYNESALLMYTALAVAWLLRALESEAGSVKQLALVGVLAGFACGVKYTAVVTLLIGLPIALLVVTLATRRKFADWVKGSAVLVVAGIATFSPWLIRNFSWTGNPVFPQAMKLLGQGHFSDAQVARWEIAHGAAGVQSSVLQRIEALGQQVYLDWRYGFLLLPMAILVFAMNPSLWRDRSAIALLTLLVFLMVFWLTLTHLQSRFFIQAIPLAALLVALAPQAGWRVAGGVAAAVMVLVGLGLNNDAGGGIGTRINHFVAQDTQIRASGANEALLGASDLKFMRSELVDAIPMTDHLALAGDAKAFIYERPIGTFSYRTVFDVDVKPGQSSIDAWVVDAPAGAKILASPAELDRFNRTYSGIPALPAGLNPQEAAVMAGVKR